MIKPYSATLLFLVLLCAVCESAWGTFVIRSQTSIDIELIGYNGLASDSLYKGRIAAEGEQQIHTTYRGLALLLFPGGQRYPFIISDAFFTLNIAGPGEPPAFTGSGENEFLSRQLTGTGPEGIPSDFALLLLRAQQLLESTHDIRTVEELSAKKEEVHEFVREQYARLRYSDMVRRLVDQYFMMHEYVSYHTEGAPPDDIRARYQQAVLDGVDSWLAILGPHISEHEILNYCLALYYERSMVTLAALIAEHFQDAAFCPGTERGQWSFPQNLHVVDAGGGGERELGAVKGGKIIALVSDDCPVSMVAAVSRARQLADRNTDARLIVLPLQPLSEKHLAMNRMVSNGNLLFINDEQWRNSNLAEKIRLPLFVLLGDDVSLPVRTSAK